MSIAHRPSTGSARFPRSLNQILRCNAGIWAAHYFCGTSDYSNDFRLTSWWETHVVIWQSTQSALFPL